MAMMLNLTRSTIGILPLKQYNAGRYNQIKIKVEI